MAGADDDAAEELALCAVWKDVDEIESELLEIVMKHHEIAVLALQFFFIGFDLYLSGHWPLLFHIFSLVQMLN